MRSQKTLPSKGGNEQLYEYCTKVEGSTLEYLFAIM